MRRKTRETKQFLHFQDLINSLIGITNQKMTLRAASVLKLLQLVGRPTSLTSNAVHLSCIYRVICFCYLFAVLSKKRMHMNTHLECLWIMAKMFIYFPVIIK